MPIALSDYALTTLETVKEELGLTDTSQDNRLLRLINTATDEIERFCGRRFARGTVTEQRPGTGTQRLVLGRPPILSITSITPSGGEALDESEYTIEHAGAGLVYRRAGWAWSGVYVPNIAGMDRLPGSEEGAYTVVYVGGFVLPQDDGNPDARTLPYDVENACVEIVTGLHHGQGRDKNVTLEQLMSAQQSFGRGWSMMPESVQQTLLRWRLDP